MNGKLNKEQHDEIWDDPQVVASVIFPGFDYSALRAAMEQLRNSDASGDDDALDYWQSVFANVADLVGGAESVDAKTVKYTELVKLYAQGRYQQADEEIAAFEGQKETTIGQAGSEYDPADPISHSFPALSPKP